MSNGSWGFGGEKQWTGTGTNAPNGPETPVPDALDALFDSLSDARRRYLLYYVQLADCRAANLDEVVAAVEYYETAGREGDDDPDPAEIRLELHHNHLPRLADAGLLTYDPQRKEVGLTGPLPFDDIVEHTRRQELD